MDFLTESAEADLRWDIEILVGSATDLLDRLERQIVPLLSGSLRCVLDLGIEIAEGQYRSDVFRFMHQRPPAAFYPFSSEAPAELSPSAIRDSLMVSDPPNGAEVPASVLFGSTSDQSLPATPLFIWKFFARGKLPAPRNWLHEVGARWGECGLPEFDVVGLNVNANSATSVNEFVQTIEDAFADALGEAERLQEPNEPLPPNNLGILDESCGDLNRVKDSDVGLLPSVQTNEILEAIDKPGTKRRRDVQFLAWREHDKMTPAPIRDRWREEHPVDGLSEGEKGINVVKQGIKSITEFLDERGWKLDDVMLAITNP